MRRLILEGSMEEFRKLDGEPADISMELIKSFEILHFLRFDLEEFSAICRVEMNDPSTNIGDVFLCGKIEATLLEREKHGACICFIKESMQPSSQDLRKIGAYFLGPCEVIDGRVRMSFMGEKERLEALIDYVKGAGVHFTVVSLTDPKFSRNSPLDCLTKKQRTVMLSAFEKGYYDLPRRISSQKLAKGLNIRSSTLIEHRRKAERRLLIRIMNDYKGEG